MFPAYCTGQDVIFKEHCSRKPRAMGSGSEFGLAPDRKAWAEDKPRSLSPGPPSLNLRPPLASLGSENASARGRPASPCGAQCFPPPVASLSPAGLCRVQGPGLPKRTCLRLHSAWGSRRKPRARRGALTFPQLREAELEMGPPGFLLFPEVWAGDTPSLCLLPSPGLRGSGFSRAWPAPHHPYAPPVCVGEETGTGWEGAGAGAGADTAAACADPALPFSRLPKTQGDEGGPGRLFRAGGDGRFGSVWLGNYSRRLPGLPIPPQISENKRPPLAPSLPANPPPDVYFPSGTGTGVGGHGLHPEHPRTCSGSTSLARKLVLSNAVPKLGE